MTNAYHLGNIGIASFDLVVTKKREIFKVEFH